MVPGTPSQGRTGLEKWRSPEGTSSTRRSVGTGAALRTLGTSGTGFPLVRNRTSSPTRDGLTHPTEADKTETGGKRPERSQRTGSTPGPFHGREETRDSQKGPKKVSHPRTPPPRHGCNCKRTRVRGGRRDKAGVPLAPGAPGFPLGHPLPPSLRRPYRVPPRPDGVWSGTRPGFRAYPYRPVQIPEEGRVPGVSDLGRVTRDRNVPRGPVQ